MACTWRRARVSRAASRSRTSRWSARGRPCCRGCGSARGRSSGPARSCWRTCRRGRSSPGIPRAPSGGASRAKREPLAGQHRPPGELVELRAHVRLPPRPPRPMLGVPLDGLAEALVERDVRAPAELGLDLPVIKQVALVVTGAVGDLLLQRSRLAERPEDRVRELLDAALDSRSHVVRLADAALA